MNSTKLTCRKKYVSWQASWIEFKSTSSNTILEYFVVYFVLSWSLVFYSFINYFLCHIPWNLSKNPPKYAFWCCSDYIIRNIFVIFGFYNPKTLSCFWTVAFHQRFGQLVEPLMHFWMISTTNTFSLTVLMT